MRQFLVITKGKSYLIDADKFGFKETADRRHSVYVFFRNGKAVATFSFKDVKAIIEQ